MKKENRIQSLEEDLEKIKKELVPTSVNYVV
jgi:hypothetical protein